MNPGAFLRKRLSPFNQLRIKRGSDSSVFNMKIQGPFGQGRQVQHLHDRRPTLLFCFAWCRRFGGLTKWKQIPPEVQLLQGGRVSSDHSLEHPTCCATGRNEPHGSVGIQPLSLARKFCQLPSFKAPNARSQNAWRLRLGLFRIRLESTPLPGHFSLTEPMCEGPCHKFG